MSTETSGGPARSAAQHAKVWAWTKWLLRIAVSTALLGVVIVRTDAGQVSALAARAHLGWWAFGLILTMIAPLATAQRSRLLIHGLGHRLTLGSVVAVNLEAIFFGLVLPGELVAGMVRWGRFSIYIGDRASALALLVVERLIDWVMLGLAAGAGAHLLFGGPSAPLLRAYTVVLAGALVAFSCAAVLAGRSQSLDRASRAWRQRLGPRTQAWTERLARLVTAGRCLAGDARRSTMAVLWSGAFWCLYCTGCVAMARAVAPQMPVAPYVAAMAALLLLTQIPLTVAGIGLRELSLPVLLGAYGVTGELGLLLGLSLFLSHALLGGAGLLVHLSGRAQLAEVAPPRATRRSAGRSEPAAEA